MQRFFGASLVAVLVMAGGPARADEKEAIAVIDKGIAALGGAEALAKADAMTWQSTGKMTFNDNTSEFKGKSTTKGIDHLRSEFEGDFNGNTIKGVIVLAGSKGWRMFGENLDAMEGDALAAQKRTAYLQVVPTTLLPLKGKGFKVESAADAKVGDKPVAVVKATGPDGKDFQLSFDKETGLPAKLVAMVSGFGGEEFSQETTFADYKDFGGIKKATKVESKRDGERFLEQSVTEFKALDKVEAGTFDEPK